MSNLSIRARLLIMLGLFIGITLLLSSVSIVSLSNVRETVDEVVGRWAVVRGAAMAISRDFEAVNAEQNGMLVAANQEDLLRRTEEEDRLFKEIDKNLATLDHALAGEQQAHLARFKGQYEDYRRYDAQLRRMIGAFEADKAIHTYLNEAVPLVARMRDRLAHGIESLDRTKGSSTAAHARELLVSVLALNEGLGALVLELNDASMEQMSKRLAESWQQTTAQLDALREADADGQRLALPVGRMLDDYHKVFGDIEKSTKTNDRAHSLALALKQDSLVKSTRDSIQQIVTKATADEEAAKLETEGLSNRARMLQILVSILGVAVGGSLAVFTILRINRGVDAVRQVAFGVADSSRELRQATLSISQRASEEASSLEETSSTMEEMTAAVDQNRSGAVKAKELAERNREAARQGAEVTGQAADAMRTLRDAGTKIADISDTVSELAFQTNILALNASVEAARAGEHGRGFTVVASEVRTLAQRSGVAAREISSLIKDSIQRIERGADLVGRASDEMTRVVDISREVMSLVANISAATQEQASGITQVSQSVLQLNQVVQANSAQAEEMAATAEGLNGQAQELVRAVVMITGIDETTVTVGVSAGNDGGPTPPKRGGGSSNGVHLKNGAAADPQALLADPIHGSPRAADFRSF